MSVPDASDAVSIPDAIDIRDRRREPGRCVATGGDGIPSIGG
jgi:hypothetical protein